MLPYINYPTSAPINFCNAFTDICTKVLDHLNAPSNSRSIQSCSDSVNYETFIGTCNLNNLELGEYIGQNIMTAILAPNAGALLITFPPSLNRTALHLSTRLLSTATNADSVMGVHVTQADRITTQYVPPVSLSLKSIATAFNTKNTTLFDSCGSYLNYCKFFLDQIECPEAQRTVHACSDSSTVYTFGTPQTLTPVCTCGGINTLSVHVLDLFTDQMIDETLNNNYLNIVTADPYTLTVSSDPFGQLTATNPPGPV
jgi:hypothetical protein